MREFSSAASLLVLSACLSASLLAQDSLPQDSEEPLADYEIFAMRPVALPNDPQAKLEREWLRALAWLQIGDHRAEIRRNPRRIHDLNEWAGKFASATRVRWYPRLIHARDNRWRHSFAGREDLGRRTVTFAIPLYSRSEWEAGPKNAEDVLVELLPLSLHEGAFGVDDLESLDKRADEQGGFGVGYEMKRDRAKAYGEWTESLINRHVAMVFDGVVVSVPIMLSRIPSKGMITGNRGEAETDAMIKRWNDAKTKPTKDQRTEDERRDGERDDVRAISKIDAEILSARADRTGANGYPVLSLRDLNAARESLSGKLYAAHGIAMSIGASGYQREFILIDGLWKCLVDEHAPDWVWVTTMQDTVETGRVYGVWGTVRERDGRAELGGAVPTKLVVR